MQLTLRQYNEQRQAKGRQIIRMGIGLHTGPLVMGIIGDRNRMDAATISDTVNTASRVENLTKYYGASVLLSESSFEKMVQCRPQFEGGLHSRYLGKVLVKGKKEPFGIYECFGGDTADLIKRKSSTIADFQKGLAHFFAREFPEAAGAFNRVLKANPEDQPARLFLHNASRYTVEGVPDDWTGEEVMGFK